MYVLAEKALACCVCVHAQRFTSLHCAVLPKALDSQVAVSGSTSSNTAAGPRPAPGRLAGRQHVARAPRLSSEHPAVAREGREQRAGEMASSLPHNKRRTCPGKHNWSGIQHGSLPSMHEEVSSWSMLSLYRELWLDHCDSSTSTLHPPTSVCMLTS